ncbi:MAG: hypothetical protein AUJ19_01455 [Parcubacteria group bacterium CG1_02_58_44]|nr:MAG: hypothetical protein AUJ19_01455 [Parcubacteria group bacterium CG1_02_58_44]
MCQVERQSETTSETGIVDKTAEIAVTGHEETVRHYGCSVRVYELVGGRWMYEALSRPSGGEPLVPDDGSSFSGRRIAKLEAFRRIEAFFPEQPMIVWLSFRHLMRCFSDPQFDPDRLSWPNVLFFLRLSDMVGSESERSNRLTSLVERAEQDGRAVVGQGDGSRLILGDLGDLLVRNGAMAVNPWSGGDDLKPISLGDLAFMRELERLKPSAMTRMILFRE